MIKIGQVLVINIQRAEAHFDRACDSAWRSAVSSLHIDDDGNSDRVEGWERSDCWVEMKFVSYVRMGTEHFYRFKARVQKAKEPD